MDGNIRFSLNELATKVGFLGTAGIADPHEIAGPLVSRHATYSVQARRSVGAAIMRRLR